jgi:hypothetical protein
MHTFPNTVQIACMFTFGDCDVDRRLMTSLSVVSAYELSLHLFVRCLVYSDFGRSTEFHVLPALNLSFCSRSSSTVVLVTRNRSANKLFYAVHSSFSYQRDVL